jgi:aminomethyltransferase
LSPLPEDGLLLTSLHDIHLSSGARLVKFAGWDMPLQYSGILAEARTVRSTCGIFDVSHMGRLVLEGADSLPLLEKLLTPQISNLKPGQSRYGFLLNDNGGIIDDILVSNLEGGPEEPPKFLVVCNASTREVVSSWLNSWITSFSQVKLSDTTFDTAMIALQGPTAASVIAEVFELQTSALRRFQFVTHKSPTYSGHEPFTMSISRTGYTGEDGFEIICPSDAGGLIWKSLEAYGVLPCGLGARDALRLEAGLMLSGVDINESTTPLEAQLDRFINLKKSFVGRDTLVLQQSRGLSRKLVGFRLLNKGIARHGYSIHRGTEQIGVVTSGGFSIMLDTSIGLGYVSIEHSEIGSPLSIDIRGRLVPAEVTETPFYRKI